MAKETIDRLAQNSRLLQEMFSHLPVTAFLKTSFLKVPCATPGTCFEALHLGDRTKLVALLSHLDADVLIGREGTVWPGEVPRDAAAIDAVLKDGFTIGLRHVHLIDNDLAQCAREFEVGFGAPVDIHLYCTPADQPGFGWHYDAEDVFVLQTHGGKEWRLRKNTVNPWPLMETIPKNQRYEREIMPIMSCRLSAGDWLYIPAGYWHETRAYSESISLSVGLRCPTALDLYDSLRAQLVHELLWRQRLPCQGRLADQTESSMTDWHALRKSLGHDLVQRLAGIVGDSL